nr:hypothetical protein [Tanacetum cinerariifolium]
LQDHNPPQLFISLDGNDNDVDYDKESIISTNTNIFKTPLSIVITTSPLVLPNLEPEDSLIIGNEELNTILEKESDEFIKSSVEDLIPIPSESKDTSGSESLCILPSCVREHREQGSYESNLDEPDLLVTPLLLIRMSVSTWEAMMMKSMFWIVRTVIMTQKETYSILRV